MNAWGNVNRDRPIGTSKEAWIPFDNKADDWFRACDEGKRTSAEAASARLRDACQRTKQVLPPDPPRRRLTFEEQLALVAAGRARIVDLGANRA